MPESLAEIYSRIGKFSESGIPYVTRFRVREIATLYDYCIWCVVNYGNDGHPSLFKAWELDHFAEECRLSGYIKQFVLLSSTEEIDYLSSLSYPDFRGVLLDSYRSICLKKFECMFGEG